MGLAKAGFLCGSVRFDLSIIQTLSHYARCWTSIMLFKSIVDWWYYLLIVVIAIVVLFSTIPPVKSGQLSVFVAFGIILLSLGLPVWLLFTTYYRVSSDALRVKSGPFNWDIPLEEIHSVSPNRSSRSSPALSLDRLEIK